MKGYFLIPIWLLGFTGTTIMLIAAWLLSLVKSNKEKPYFKARSIFNDPKNCIQ